MQNVALDSLKTKIEELEGQLKKEQEGHSTALVRGLTLYFVILIYMTYITKKRSS